MANLGALEVAIPLFLALLPCASAQSAGPGVDARGPSIATLDADVRDPLWLRRPGPMHGGDAFAGALLGYQRSPLVQRNDDTGDTSALLENVFTLDASAGWAPTGWLRLDVVASLVAFDGSWPGPDPSPTVQRTGIGLADTTVSALVQLIAPPDDTSGVGLALVPQLDLPTGRPDDDLGRGAIAGGGDLVVSLDQERLSLTGSAGIQLDPRPELGVPGGPSVRLGAAGTWLFDESFGIGGELIGGVPLDAGGAGIPLEALVRARSVRESGAHLTAGAGVGLGPGVGTPAYRVFIGGGFGRSGEPRDRDGDGIVDAEDRCPDSPETLNGLDDADGCPDALPVLFVSATVDGAAVPGVTITLDGPEDRILVTRETPERIQVGQGTSWRASATLGACLRGEALTTVDDADRDLAVPLERLAFAEVEALVLDRRGRPAEGARVVLSSDDPTCVPSAPIVVPPDGRVRTTVGPGIHRVSGTLEDLAGALEVTVEEGRTHELILVLK